MKHMRALDGVRGVAIIMVMFFHLQIPGFSLGWAGVPLFFCLSGFLITGILLEHKSKPLKEYLAAFFINRALRIFPLFYAYLLVNYLFLKLTGQSSAGYMWFVFYLQNMYIGLTGTTPGFVIQTWSLAAEEQFYWLWPFAIFFIKNKNMVKVFSVLIVFSVLARSWIFHASGNNPYMFNATLLSCTDGLILGALMAKIKDQPFAGKVSALLLVIGALATLYAVITVGLNAFWLPSGWVSKCEYLPTAMAMVFTAFIFYAYRMSKDSSAGALLKVLNSKSLVYTGKISYGLYMWHLACFFVITVIFRKLGLENQHALYFITSLIVTYICSTLSYYLFEVHFLKLKRKSSDPLVSAKELVS